jgi:hypothetical protein
MLANTTAAYVNQNTGDFIKDNMSCAFAADMELGVGNTGMSLS